MTRRALAAPLLALLVGASNACTGSLDASDRSGGDDPPDVADAEPPLQGDGAPRTDAAGAPPDAASGGAELTAAEIDLLAALNAARDDNDLPPVAIDERLLCAARNHALDVGTTGSCGHVGSDGSWPWDRAEACGYPQDDWTVNEIAAGPGFTDGADAVWGWSQSPGHWAAIVHTEARTVGVGIHDSCFIALFDCCVAGGAR